MKLMLKKLTTLLICAFLLSGALLLVTPAKGYALFENSKNQACAGAALSDAPVSCDPSSSSTSVAGILTVALNLLSLVVGVLAVVMIIIGGLRFVLSGGDSNTTNSARNTIIYAIVGLAIAAFSQIIVHFVLNKIKS